VSLKLALHPRKVSITTVASGVDFLDWVHFRTPNAADGDEKANV
jgi:hypothetical protein